MAGFILIFFGLTMRQHKYVVFTPYQDFDTDDPVRVKCPYCKVEMFTRVKSRTGIGAWLASGAILFLGWFCGCCLIPFYLKEFQEFKHYCRNCSSLIGNGHGIATC